MKALVSSLRDEDVIIIVIITLSLGMNFIPNEMPYIYIYF